MRAFRQHWGERTVGNANWNSDAFQTMLGDMRKIISGRRIDANRVSGYRDFWETHFASSTTLKLPTWWFGPVDAGKIVSTIVARSLDDVRSTNLLSITCFVRIES